MTSKQTDNTAIQELRKLLFESESSRISDLEQLIHDQNLHAKEVAKVLAEAVRLRNRTDNELGQALSPTIEKSIKASIARDPKPLSDALFPVMGPAIRKSIQNSLASMLESLNQTLEHSFSPQGIRWRWDAFRTGKSFAEIVVLNTLVYRVEQVFLMHKETGLLLHHLSFDPTLHEDADIVSSMLTAVQDFIQDSFSGSTEQGIENLRMGDLEVLIEQAPDVVLAVVCRGNPSRSLHEVMQETVEKIQRDFAIELQQFEGDASSFEHADEILNPLLVSDFKNKSHKQKKSPIKAILAVSLIFIALFGWFGWTKMKQHDFQERWGNFITQLSSEPGIVITHASCDDNQVCRVHGLKDPLSIEPKSLLKKYHLPLGSILFSFQPYYALQESLILKRVIQLIQPPESVEVSLQNNTLLLSGVAPETWLNQAEKAALYLAGINNIDSTKLVVNHQPVTKGTQSPQKRILRKKLKLEDAAILKRANQVLTPPQTASLHYANGILRVSGKYTLSWIKFVKENYHTIPGVKSLQTYNLKLTQDGK